MLFRKAERDGRDGGGHVTRWFSRAMAGLACAAALATAAPAEARWLKAESPHFVVYSDGSEGALRDYVRKLEIFDAVLRKELGVAGGGAQKLPMYLLDSKGELKRVSPELASRVAGFWTSGQHEVFAVALRERGGDHVLLHEYVHHFMFQHRPYGYPGWYVEGAAEYFMTTDIEKKQIEVGRFNPDRARTLQQFGWLPLQQLLSRRPTDFKKDQAPTYYPQAWLLTHYMMSDPGRQAQLMSYLQAVGERGADPVKALEGATGRSIPELEKTLRSYFNGTIVHRVWPVGGYSVPTISVAAMPPSADELLLEGQAFKAGQRPEDAAALLARVRAKAPRFGSDRLAQITLARGEVRFGDRAAGEALLEKLIAADPNDAEALALLAWSRLETAVKEPDRRLALHREAARYLARAYKADPNRYQTLLGLARSRSVAADYPTENDLETLRTALELAPSVSGLRLQLAQALARKGRYAEVARLLPPLANSPHGGEDSASARRLLAEARERLTTATPKKPAG